MAIAELINALMVAKICTLNPRSTSSLNRLSNTMAVNTTTEKIPISHFAFLSFLFIEASNMFICLVVY